MNPDQTPDEIAAADPVVSDLALGHQFQREVNAVLEDQFGGDIGHPGWIQYCADMDALRGIEPVVPEDPAGSPDDGLSSQ